VTWLHAPKSLSWWERWTIHLYSNKFNIWSKCCAITIGNAQITAKAKAGYSSTLIC
jgi:hypothetical protein